MSSAKQINSLEERLAQFAGRAEAILLGQANTALFLTLKYLSATRGPGEVILSPIVCPSVVQTILYAGFEPIFVDVGLPLCTIDAAKAARAVGPRTRAILGIHIFGHSADMPALATLAQKHDIWLIEDAAQSIGGVIAGRRHGGWGNVSLYSFGASKIVSAGVGGALLSDDATLLSYARYEAARLPPLVSDALFQHLSLSHRNLIHALMDSLRVQRDVPVWRSFAAALDLYRPLFLHSFPDSAQFIEAIGSGIDRMDEGRHERARRATAYRDGLAGLAPLVQLVDRSVCEGVVWRFTMLVLDQAQTIAATRALREVGLHASNHYWSAAELLDGERGLAHADFASSRLLNLWVEPSIEMAEVERAVDILGAVIR